jgi:predicted DNA-binding transcriptional regulator AlpA
MLKTEEAAKIIGKSPSWLNKTRMTGVGPVYLRIGGSVRYRQEDLESWLAGCRRTAVYSHANSVSARAQAA